MGINTARAIRVGEELPPVVKPISQRQIDAYSGVRPKSIHTDADWAKKKGFAAPLAQGMMSTAYVSEMMVELLGEGFVKGGRMAVSFIKPVLAGDTLTMHGTVRDVVPDGERMRVTVDFVCENQNGIKTMVGEASGLSG